MFYPEPLTFIGEERDFHGRPSAQGALPVKPDKQPVGDRGILLI
jgi:hypothetical protein